MLATVGNFILVVTCISTVFNVVPTKATELKTYIVHLSSPKAPPNDIEQWYNSFLSKVASRSIEKPVMVYTYRHVIIGFAARMSPDQAKLMQTLSGVLYVQPERMHQLQTTRSPHFLGLRQDSGLWKDSNYGKGVIIGLIDTGITPSHPSFNDHGVPPPPSTWKGKCEVAGCNNKLIGMRNFINDGSPTDIEGHGTHTANVFGLGNGTASGMAPLAHIASYKVCFILGCEDGAILAGIDAAIEDGVNVLSISLGALNASTYYDDAVELATFTAVQKGIFVSCAAANSGPKSSSLSNEAPWILTVGASTIDRRFRTSVLLGNNKLFHGESLYQPKDADRKLRPLVYPLKDGKTSALCLPGSLDHIDVKGKVVLCDVGDDFGNINKGKVVKDAGGVAVIIANDIISGESIAAERHLILASSVGYREGVEIKKYLNSTSSPVATILCGGTVVDLKSDPEMAYFSSRGPNSKSPGILKPDVTGPGVDIMAAWPRSVDNQTRTKATFMVIEGTSMSCPHLSGIAALLKSAHPEWSPAAIKSAIMTTASQMNRNGTAIVDQRTLPADVFAIGSGHVNPQKAHEPGIVFDIQPDDYIPYLCGLGYTPLQIEMIVKKKVNCSKTIPEAQLNYASFAVSLKRGESKTYSRTVTNVDETISYYTLRDTSVPKGVSIKIMVDNNKDLISFTSAQQTITYDVTFSRDANDNEKGPYGQGHMTWVSDTDSCLPGALDHIDVKGKVVLCDAFYYGNIIEMGMEVKKAGGASMIIANDIILGEHIPAEVHVILASNVGYRDQEEFELDFFNSPVAAAILCGGTVVGLTPDPEMAYFSSRGPNVVVSLKRGESKTYSRTVTNVGEAYSLYTLRDTSLPKGVTIKVAVDDYQDMIIFRSMQQTRTYEVTFSRDANDTEKGPYGQGHMTWGSDTGKCIVRIPFLFKFE